MLKLQWFILGQFQANKQCTNRKEHFWFLRSFELCSIPKTLLPLWSLVMVHKVRDWQHWIVMSLCLNEGSISHRKIELFPVKAQATYFVICREITGYQIPNFNSLVENLVFSKIFSWGQRSERKLLQPYGGKYKWI